MKRLTCLALSGALAGAAVAEPVITTEQLEENIYKLTLTNDASLELGVAQDMLEDTVESLCEGDTFAFGKYKFSESKPVVEGDGETTFVLEQEVTCGAVTMRPAGLGGAIELDAEAEAKLKKDIAARTDAYLKQIDAGEYLDAYLKYDQVARDAFRVDSWTEQKKTERERSGARKSLDIWRITVYKNPMDAPSSGNYIAADYDSEFETMPIVCGYVMWYQNPTGDITIMREETGYLDQATLDKIPADDLPAVKAQIGCRTE